jgi:hypothetical protein
MSLILICTLACTFQISAYPFHPLRPNRTPHCAPCSKNNGIDCLINQKSHVTLHPSFNAFPISNDVLFSKQNVVNHMVQATG